MCKSLCWAFTQNQNIFYLLTIFVDKLISTPKIIIFRPNLIPGNEKLPLQSNPIPYPEYVPVNISILSHSNSSK